MAQHITVKSTLKGKSATLAKRRARALKYLQTDPTNLTRAARVRQANPNPGFVKG